MLNVTDQSWQLHADLNICKDDRSLDRCIGPVCTVCGIIRNSDMPYLKSKLNIPYCKISCAYSHHAEGLMFAGQLSVAH